MMIAGRCGDNHKDPIKECPGCAIPDMPYMAFVEDATLRTKRKERQIQCLDCLRWAWPDQLKHKVQP